MGETGLFRMRQLDTNNQEAWDAVYELGEDVYARRTVRNSMTAAEEVFFC